MELVAQIDLYTPEENRTIQTFISDRPDPEDCSRFFEGLVPATLLSIPLWTAIIGLILYLL